MSVLGLSMLFILFSSPNHKSQTCPHVYVKLKHMEFPTLHLKSGQILEVLWLQTASAILVARGQHDYLAGLEGGKVVW